MTKLRNLVWCLVVICCTQAQEAKFANAAQLVCDGLEEYAVYHNDILSIDMLMQRHDYAGALKVADALLQNIQEDKNVKGLGQLRALVLLLESLTTKEPA